MKKIQNYNNFLHQNNVKQPSLLKEFNSFFLGSVIFLSLMPFFVWNYGLNFFILTNSFFLWLVRKHLKRNIKFSTWFSLGLFILIFSFSIFEGNISQVKFYKFLTHIFIFIFLFLNDEFVLKVYEKFKLILFYSLLVSFLIYLIVVLDLINIPFYYVKPLNSLKESDYYVYFFLTSINTINFFNFRFFGIFDEPGVVGTITGLVLYIDHFNFKDKKNILFLLSGIFSFSLFFYFLLLVYYVLRVKNIRSILFFLFIIMLYNYTTNNELLNDLIWDRLQLVEGRLSGDNRVSETLLDQFKVFLTSSDLLFGKGGEFVNQYSEGSSSYILVLMSKGLIFSIFICYVYFYLLIKRKVGITSYIDFGIIFLGTMYQRPYYLETYFFFIFFVSSIIFSNRSKIVT